MNVTMLPAARAVRRIHWPALAVMALLTLLLACEPAPTPTAKLAPDPTATPEPIPTPTLTPCPTYTAVPTPTPKRQCEQAAAQPITQEQEATIAEWHDSLRPRMREFAAYAPVAFEEYTQRFNYYSGALQPYITLALCDEALALRLLAMPFLAVDRGDRGDGDVLGALARLTDPDVGDVDELLSHPLLEDGITEIDRVVVLLLVLEHDRPDAAAMIRRIPWVQEIMREAALSANDIQTSRAPSHHYSLHWLVEMADRSPESLRAFLELPWMKDQHIQTEHWLTDSLSTVESSIHTMATFVRHIAEKSDNGMDTILRMPFLQSLEPHDEDILDILWETSDAGKNYTDGETPLRQLLSDPALEGGITDDNLGDVALADLRVRNPESSSGLESLPWIRDGVSLSETSGILSLWKLEHLGSDIFQSVVRQQWVADGLTVYESSAIRSFEQLVIAARNIKALEDYPWHEEYVLTIPDKPFMRSIGPSDAALLRSTQQLLQEGGMRERPDLLSAILESGETQIEERLITLPLAGEVALSVVWPTGLEPDRTLRFGVSASRTMDLLEEAVSAAEEFMGLPFPQRSAVVLIHNFPGGGPPAHGGREAFVLVDPSVSDSEYIVRHEVAHAYWAAGASWIVEGGAEFITSWTSGNMPDYVSPSCMHLNTMYDFMRAFRRDGHYEYHGCNYTLGEGMFVDLYSNLGEETFRGGFTNLNLRIWGFVPSEGCIGIDKGVCYLKAAFVDSAVPDDAAVAEEIINRRYYGTSGASPSRDRMASSFRPIRRARSPAPP